MCVREFPCDPKWHCPSPCSRCLTWPGARQAYLAWSWAAQRHEDAGRAPAAGVARTQAAQALTLWNSGGRTRS